MGKFAYLAFSQQTIGIPTGTNCAPLLSDLFLHALEADFLQWLHDRYEIYISQMTMDLLLFA
jgi:hypothetical protein